MGCEAWKQGAEGMGHRIKGLEQGVEGLHRWQVAGVSTLDFRLRIAEKKLLKKYATQFAILKSALTDP